jgi:MoaA/NifB/PqqE/SkfB family radical SAM enzyme
VPPFMIASITRQCNLNCTGCYAHAATPMLSSDTTTAKCLRHGSMS